MYMYFVFNKCDIKPAVVILVKIAVYDIFDYVIVRSRCTMRWPGGFHHALVFIK